LLVVVGGSAILLLFAAAYVFVMISSHRRIVDAQESKLREVKKSEEKYRSLFDNSLAGIVTFSGDTWEVVDCNEAVRTLFACSSQGELRECLLTLPDEARMRIRETVRVQGSITEYEVPTTRKDGAELWILFSAKTIGDGHLAQAVIIDITKRKQFEEKIREQSALLDQTRDAILVIDDRGIVTFWNSGAELMYGWPKDVIVGRGIRDFLYSEAKQDDFQAAMEDITQFKEWNGQQVHRRKDGKEILVESRWRTIERASSGTSLILIVNSDVTEKKRVEAQFIRAQKMESIALLTGGMAHDLHNILAPIAMSIPLLGKKLSDASSLAILRAVEQSAQSGLDLVKNILTYGRGIVGERVVLSVDRVLDQVLNIVSQGSSTSIGIERRWNGQSSQVSGDMNQLKQVFLNLCVNARDAMPSGGKLTVGIEQSESDENLLEFYPDADPGPYVVVTVSDTGRGIPEEDLDRIFEPFFTTREEGEGTGLGLSIAQGIVKSHDGFITVHSAIDQGTTFRVYLPALVQKS
jgi:two-component system, cell cycle sensor histidine kinase and response regulator CckA